MVEGTPPNHPHIQPDGELMPDYPLMFTFRDVVSGDGFLAGVTVWGRAVMTFEDEKWWAYGVRPAGLAESGSTPQEAHARFRNRFKEVLFDIAEEAQNFLVFNSEVERFYYEPDIEEEKRWTAAFEVIRSGNVLPEHPFSSLPKEPPETRPTGITVERLDNCKSRYTPTDNVPDRFVFAAAA
jgi:hypothetical protein